MDTLQNKEVIVRKDHWCVWCGEAIKKGERAQYRVYIFDHFTTDYIHPECYSAMEKHADELHIEDGFTAGEFKRGLGELKYD